MQHSEDQAPAAVPTHSAGAMTYQPTRRQRLLKWLGFDRGWFPEFPDEALDRLPFGVWGEVLVNLSPLDRVRVLISGKMRIDFRHQCQRDPGVVMTKAYASVRWAHE